MSADAAQPERVAVVGGGIGGVAAAWSLHHSGRAVELFERGPALGGNAKTFRWSLEGGDAVESPLLVIAWPGAYYHNYHRLLAELDVPTETLPIAYFVQHPDGVFCQDGKTDLEQRLEPDFRRWDRLIRLTSRINDLFLPRNRHDSMYHFSYWNPLNLVPLYRLARWLGVSDEFWDRVFVPIHCASLITTQMKDVPAVVAPLMESVVPLQRPCRMATWGVSPRNVFDRMTAPFADAVHTRCEIVSVRREGAGFALRSADGRTFHADKVVFGCQASSIRNVLEDQSWLERTLLRRVQYVDDVDPTFSRFLVHSDTGIFPEQHRERIASEFNTYTEVAEDGHLECTFVLSSQYPRLMHRGRAMLVTFNSRKRIEGVEAEIDLPNPTHTLTVRNLLTMILMRRIQGRRGVYYCSGFTTPEGSHDLSFLSGLVAARAVGAPYPFALDDSPAVADYHLMQRIMLGRVLPDVPGTRSEPSA